MPEPADEVLPATFPGDPPAPLTRDSETLEWLRRQVVGTRVLEVGLGAAELGLALCQDGLEYLGLDWRIPLARAAHEMFDAVPPSLRWRLRLLTAGTEPLPFTHEAFDTVILSDVLPHLDHPEGVLSEARRVLARTGTLLVTVPFGRLPHAAAQPAYYPFALLELLNPHVASVALEIKERHLCFCGRKVPRAGAATLGLVDDPTRLWLLGRELEQRCQAAETALAVARDDGFAGSATLPQEIHWQRPVIVFASPTLSAQPDGQPADHQPTEPAAQQVQAVVEAATSKLKRQHQAALRKQQADLNQALAVQEAMFKRAWNWRVGSAVLAPPKLMVALLRRPREVPARVQAFWRGLRETLWPSPFVPPVEPLPLAVSQPRPTDKAVVGAIMDEFTTACLRPECHLVAFRPDNWQATLEQARPELLFVESAWNGNEGAWQYRIANYTKRFGDELRQMLAWARRRGLPSVFWNKEDPVHFERFIDSARLFDAVFTTDANVIPRYHKTLGNTRVNALPFAAQPHLHNPILEEPRSDRICFAGTYYGDRHSLRRQDLEHILGPALDYGVDIYDRQFGVVSKNADIYRFPDVYQPHIRGRLDYGDMVKAYKHYRVFLNVNSVKDSPTMFSRRVFELLASGTPVVSSYARGIVELLGEDTVFLSESEADTRRHLEHLQQDDAWMRASVKGLRTVMTAHTYAHRLASVFAAMGVRHQPVVVPSLAAVVSVADPEALAALQAALAQQRHRPAEVFLLMAPGLADHLDLESLRNALPESRITALSANDPKRYAQCLATTSAYVALLDAASYYSPNYLLDGALAGFYSGQAFIGRHTHFQFSETTETAELRQPGVEFRLVTVVPTSTLLFRPAAMTEVGLAQCLANPVFTAGAATILSLDRFNFVATGAVSQARQCALSHSPTRQQIEV